MKAKGICFFQTWLTQEVGTQGPDLNIVPFFSLDGAPEKTEKFLAVFRLLDEWLTVVGEGQRDHPASCKPTPDTTEDEAIRQVDRWSRSRINDGLIAVGPVQRREPAGRMEDGRSGMTVDELRPTRILKWIERIYLQGSCRRYSAPS